MHPQLHLLHLENLLKIKFVRCKWKQNCCMSVFCVVFFSLPYLVQCSSAHSSKSCRESQVHSGGEKRLQTGTAALSRGKVHLLCGQQAKVEKCTLAKHILSSACWPRNKFLFSPLQLSTCVPLHDSDYLASRHAANTDQLLYWAHLMNTLSSNIVTAVLPVTWWCLFH